VGDLLVLGLHVPEDGGRRPSGLAAEAPWLRAGSGERLQLAPVDQLGAQGVESRRPDLSDPGLALRVFSFWNEIAQELWQFGIVRVTVALLVKLVEN